MPFRYILHALYTVLISCWDITATAIATSCVTNFHIITITAMLCCTSYTTSHYILGMFTRGHLTTKIVHDKHCSSEEIRLCYLHDRPLPLLKQPQYDVHTGAGSHNCTNVNLFSNYTQRCPKHNFEQLFENV